MKCGYASIPQKISVQAQKSSQNKAELVDSMRFPLILAQFLSLLLDHWCTQKSGNLNTHTASLNINARTLTIVANNAAFLCHVNYTSILMKPLLTFRVLSFLCLCQDFGLVYANNTDLHVNPEQVPDISERACFCKCAFKLRSMPHQGCFKLTAVQFCSPAQDRCHFKCLHILKVTHRGLSFISKCYYSSLCIKTNTIIHNHTWFSFFPASDVSRKGNGSVIGNRDEYFLVL